MEKITYREALHRALHKALSYDPRVFILGEDIGRYGGSYAVTKGFLIDYVPETLEDTRLSDAGYVGAAVGAAIGGMRPIVEIMTINFSLLALDQIVNNAATLSHMSGGQISVPLVIRMASGAGRQLAAQHSHSWEGWYASVPGLKVLAPATVQDAYSMLALALADPNPVLIFEHAQLYNTEDAFDPDLRLDMCSSAIRRQGNDISIVTYGGSLSKVMAAAEHLASEGIDAEVLDLRVLRPLDEASILTTVQKTHRLLVVDEAWRSGSLSAEIGMRVAEKAFFHLDAPLARVCAMETPIPYAKHMEELALPQTDTIVHAAHEVLRR